MTTFLQTPAGLALMLTICILGIATILVLALCVAAKSGDNEKEKR